MAAQDRSASDPRRDCGSRGSASRLADLVWSMNPSPPVKSGLKLLSVIIPARDEEGCIASTVEHLHLELGLHNIPHEIVVVDDGSTDRTVAIMTVLCERVPEARLIQNG